MENRCPQCGAALNPEATECMYCGEKIMVQKTTQTMQQPQPQVIYVQQQSQPQYVIQQPAYVSGINPSWPIKSKIAAGILGIFLGGLGVHKFYMGKIGMGILYLIFCWTGIPSVIGFIEGVIYL